jgi:hypothetical protein
MVALVPEGLPATLSVSLAIGVRRMARRHALIKKLAAVEALGSTSPTDLNGEHAGNSGREAGDRTGPGGIPGREAVGDHSGGRAVDQGAAGKVTGHVTITRPGTEDRR